MTEDPMKEIMRRAYAACAPPDMSNIGEVFDRGSAIEALIQGQSCHDYAVKDRIMRRVEQWLVDQASHDAEPI